MEAGPTQPDPGGAAAGAEGGGEPSQEELQRQLEEQLREIRVQDLLLESVVGILNLTMRRIAKPDERDLEQARVGIEAVRSTVGLLDERAREQVREALSQVQLRFAQEARGEGEAAAEAEREGAAPAAEESPRRPSGLWTPPGSA